MIRRLLGDSARERRLRAATAIAAAIGLVFALWVLAADPLESLQRLAADAQATRDDGSPNVVIVALDEESFEEYGRLEDWPRTLHADVIDNLSDAGASVIIFDVLFADRSADAEADGALAASIREAGNVVLAAAGQGSPSLESQGAVYQGILEPTAVLASSGAVIAGANVITGDDGRVRHVPLSIRDPEGVEIPAMALAAVYRQFGRTPPTPIPFEGSSLDLFGRTVPLEDGQTMRINYVGGSDRFTTLSYVDVREGAFVPNIVDGKVVIVGLLATAADVHSVPLLGTAHGVEIQANALHTLFQASFLTPVADWVTFVTILLFVVAAALVVPRWRLLFVFPAVIAVIALYVLAGNVLYSGGQVVDFVDPPVALAVTTVAALSYREMSQRASQRETQDLFGRYVSPQVAHELLERADHGTLELGGELREVTVLFADIRGFTPLSTRLPPQELVTLLNQHFEVIISRIMENGGIVNKFAGDAVMALWNAPEDQPDHALLACRAA
ncbi:MAG: CHASE2 domain-containing protein, partial [Dehalococcoidia bacterium]